MRTLFGRPEHSTTKNAVTRYFIEAQKSRHSKRRVPKNFCLKLLEGFFVHGINVLVRHIFCSWLFICDEHMTRREARQIDERCTRYTQQASSEQVHRPNHFQCLQQRVTCFHVHLLFVVLSTSLSSLNAHSIHESINVFSHLTSFLPTYCSESDCMIVCNLIRSAPVS